MLCVFYRIHRKCHYDYVFLLNAICKNCFTFIEKMTAPSHLRLNLSAPFKVPMNPGTFAPQILISLMHCDLRIWCSICKSWWDNVSLSCANSSTHWMTALLSLNGSRMRGHSTWLCCQLKCFSVFSNLGLLEPKKLYKLPCLFSYLINVENESRIAKKKMLFLFLSFQPLLQTRRCTLKKPLSGVEEWIL